MHGDFNSSELLLKLINDLNKSSNLNDTYNVILNSVVKLDIVDMTAIYQINESGMEAELAAQINLPKSYLKTASIIPKPKGLTWRVIETKKLLVVEDVRKDPHIGLLRTLL